MRASWKVSYGGTRSGPYCIQLATSGPPLLGIHYRPPLPQHCNYPTRKAAEEVKRTLPRPFIRHGIVIDGITTCGVIVTGRPR